MMQVQGYAKREAGLISGIAILLMVAHHFFGFKSYLRPDVEWVSLFSLGGIEVERVIGAFGKICVSIFAFNSGYVLWTRRQEYKSWKSRFKRLTYFLLCYWVICAIFWLFAYLSGDKIPHGVDILYNLVGLHTGPDYDFVNVAFGWYVAYYIFFVLASPVILWVSSSSKWLVDVTVLFAIFISVQYVAGSFDSLNFIWPLYISVSAVFVAKYRIFERVWSRFGNCRMLIASMIILIIIIVRQGLLLIDNEVVNKWGGVAEPIYVLTFIYCVISIVNRVKFKPVEQFLALLGVLSMNIWFLHGVFFTGSRILQPILYFADYSILVYLWGLILMFPVVWGITKFQTQLKRYLA